MRIVVAPDSFKGTLTAAEAARAIADGWASVRPDDTIALRPMADGGEGTLDAFATLPGAERVPVDVVDAVGQPRRASWVLLPDGTGVVELAECCGLLTIDEPAPRDAHTLGFGLAIRDALAAGVTRLLLAIGGSASTDGGLGLLVGLGVVPLPEVHRPATDEGAASGHSAPAGAASPAIVPSPGNSALPSVAALEWGGALAPPAGGAFVLSDVTNPLLGPTGAAAVFGPQKGGADIVDELDTNLAAWARVLGGDPDAPGAGAAGGAGYALQRWGATTVSGARAVADAVGLPAALEGADLVITGEGSFDAQTAGGKAVAVVRSLAGDARTALVAGRIDADVAGLAGAVSLLEVAPDEALARPAKAAFAAGRDLAARLAP